MSRNHSRWLFLGALLVAAILIVPQLSAQEKKTSADPTPNAVDVDRIWNFYWTGKKKNGEVLELAQLDGKEARGRSLVITRLDSRTPVGVRWEVIEHRRGKDKKWKKKVRRGLTFTDAFVTASTEYSGTEFNSFVGMKFDPGTRPAIAIARGSGEMWFYAEGYWSRD